MQETILKTPHALEFTSANKKIKLNSFFLKKKEEKNQLLEDPVLLPFHLAPVWQLTFKRLSTDSQLCRPSHSYSADFRTEQNQYSCTGFAVLLYTSQRTIYEKTSQSMLLTYDNIFAFCLWKIFLFSLKFPRTIS